MQEIEAIAKEIAAELGRDWSDCGTYERQTFMDEALNRLDGDEPNERDELPDCVWGGAFTPFAKNH